MLQCPCQTAHFFRHRIFQLLLKTSGRHFMHKFPNETGVFVLVGISHNAEYDTAVDCHGNIVFSLATLHRDIKDTKALGQQERNLGEWGCSGEPGWPNGGAIAALLLSAGRCHKGVIAFWNYQIRRPSTLWRDDEQSWGISERVVRVVGGIYFHGMQARSPW